MNLYYVLAVTAVSVTRIKARNDGREDGPELEASRHTHSGSLEQVQTRQVDSKIRASSGTANSGNPDELSSASGSHLPGPIANPEDAVPAPNRIVRHNTIANNAILFPGTNNLNENSEVSMDNTNTGHSDVIRTGGTKMHKRSRVPGDRSHHVPLSSKAIDETRNSDGGQEKWIRLNVGGQIFTTSRTTLCAREPNSMLAIMFCYDSSASFNPSRRDETGAYMIDRSPKYFEPVLNYLRQGELIIDKNVSIQGVLKEAEFFGIESMIPLLKAPSSSRQDLMLAMMSVPQGLNLQCFNLSGVDLSRLNLKGAYLRYADLRGANLKNTDLSLANLEHADLFGSNIKGTKLSGANLEGCNLAGLNLSKRNLVRMNMKYADLRGADLRDSNLSEANLEYADLSGANILGTGLSEVKFEGCILAGQDLSMKCLSRVSLKHADLKDANLQGADLSYSDLRHADMYKSNLEGARLAGTTLAGANLEKSNLKSITRSEEYRAGILDLRELNFQGANLTGATFDGSNLVGVNFSGAILRGASFRNCYLTDAVMDGADIKNCNFV